jgi:hypothetical protein
MASGYARICVAVVSLFTSSAFGAGPHGSIRVGNWSGGAFTNDQTGAFSHCSASTPYANGVVLLVAQNASGSWTLGFGSPSFKLAVDETFPINITFDGQAQFRLFGAALTPELVVAVLPGNTALEQLRKAHLMVAEAKGVPSSSI